MLLGFKRRFAPFVLDGTKTHTIRATRKNAPRVGEACHCYVDPRQKTMALLGRWPCIRVEPIVIYELGDGTGKAQARFNIFVDGQQLSADERNQFAWCDGFRDQGLEGAWDSMMRFWMTTHGNAFRKAGFVFEGDIIHWNPAVRLPDPGITREARA